MEKRNRVYTIIGIIIFIFAVIQSILLILYLNSDASGKSQIILNGETITTEVCTEWFNYTSQQTTLPQHTFNYYEHPIPIDVVVEVCDKWKKVKEEIDNGS